MALMDLILVTVYECNVAIVDKQTSAIRFYEKHNTIPFTDLRRPVAMVSAYENCMIVWID